MKNIKYIIILFSCFFACADEELPPLQIESIWIGNKQISLTNPLQNVGIAADQAIVITCTAPLASSSVEAAVSLTTNGTPIPHSINVINNNLSFLVQPSQTLNGNETYSLTISSLLQGKNKETFKEVSIQFTTSVGQLKILSAKIDGIDMLTSAFSSGVSRDLSVEIEFSAPLNESSISSAVTITGSNPGSLLFSLQNENRKLVITSSKQLQHLSRYIINFNASLRGSGQETFAGFARKFYTLVDPTPKQPLLPNDQDSDNDNTNDLLSVVQQQTFKYFWDFSHPASGMARERNTSGNLVTSGGSGFGIMSLIVGMERNFITRTQGLERMDKILDFLEVSDRFHGAWPHWLDGNTGNVIPFSANDNGGDLVETAFLVEGLITFRQYLNAGVTAEQQLINRINVLWKGVEWDWYRQNNQNVMYWHWSPDKNWTMNHQVKGWNECLITYVLAASADDDNTIPKSVYDTGWASGGGMKNGNTYEGITLPLGFDYGGPLFFTHYSFLGLDPRTLSDQYANYWTQNVSHSTINYKYSIRNPRQFVGYSDECWGLTASDNHLGYNAHSPTNDLGVISPTAALSSFPYTPQESMKALKFFYYTMGDKVWGQYGFYDAFNVTEDWYANSYLAIDQGPILIMIENYRTGLLWDLFMSAPEVNDGLDKLGFSY